MYINVNKFYKINVQKMSTKMSRKRCIANVYKFCRKFLKRQMATKMSMEMPIKVCNCLQSDKHERSTKLLEEMKRKTRDTV